MMRSEKSVKSDLLDALGGVADGPLDALGFKRRGNSLAYERRRGEAIQSIAFVVDFFPKYEPDTEAHIHPMIRLSLPSVSDRALQLVDGNKMLLANAPEVILNQPIEFSAPKDKHARWFASGAAEFNDRVREIVDFLGAWTIPLLDELDTVESLARIYEHNDSRLLRQQHWYVFIAAAFDLLGRPAEARSVLEDQLGAPALRRRYGAAFSKLAAA